MCCIPFFFLPPTASSVCQAASSTFPTELNLDVPNAPALDLLGLTASKASSPVNLQQLAYTAINSYDANGVPTQGIAYTRNPWQLGLINEIVDVDDFTKRRNWLQRAIYNTSLSVAIAKGANDPEAVSAAAFGISVPVINDTDWRLDKTLKDQFVATLAQHPPVGVPEYHEPLSGESTVILLRLLADYRSRLGTIAADPALSSEIQGAAKRANSVAEEVAADLRQTPISVDPIKDFEKLKGPLTTLQTLGNAYLKDRQAAIDKAIKGLSDKTWNAQALTFAAGTDGTSQTQAFDTFGYGGWGTYARPIGNYAQGLVSARGFHEVSMTIGSMKKAAPLNGYMVAARVRGGDSSTHGFLEYQYIQGTPETGATVFDHVLQGGVEFKLAGEWVQIGLGKSLTSARAVILGLNLNFTTASKPTLNDEGAPAAPAG